MSSRLHLSIITSVYQCSRYIEEFYARIAGVACRITDDYEIIFVNDGSNDDSLEKLKALQAQDARVVIIDLTRNFGQHPALWLGLKESRGDFVFVIDCDLEESPEHLESFYHTLHSEQASVVFAAQKTRPTDRKGHWYARMFYWLLRNSTDLPIVPDVLMMRLMTREYVDAVLQFKERDPRLTIISYVIGFKKVCVPIEKTFKGSSLYTFSKKVEEACQYIAGITNKPLSYILYAGFYIVLAAILTCIGLLLAGCSGNLPYILVAIAISTGLLLMALGVIGVYLGRVFTEVRGQPLPMIRHIYKA